MDSQVLRFESLPNEILFEIFQYFDAKQLFRLFYNLNSDFNTLLQSVNNLFLSLKTSSYGKINHDNYLIPYVNILIIYDSIEINLNSFIKLRRLILVKPTDEFLQQLEINHLPYLEHLYIRLASRNQKNWSHLFLNGFSDLKTCCIYKPGLLTIILAWPQISSLRILKIGDINLSIYKSILLSCPNLNFLKFTLIESNTKSMDTFHHSNLKKLVIVIPWFEELSEDCDMNFYFLFIPNLEQLTIHRTDESRYINESYLKFHWYGLLIKSHLSSLSYFTYYFHILKSFEIIPVYTYDILEKIQKNFSHIHCHINQCRFNIDIF